jgi:hypothetical protein
MNNKEIMSRVDGCIYPYVRILDSSNIDSSSEYIQTHMVGKLIDVCDSEIEDSYIFTIEYAGCKDYNSQFEAVLNHDNTEKILVSKSGHNFEIVSVKAKPNFTKIIAIQKKITKRLKDCGVGNPSLLSKSIMSSIISLI